MQTLLRTKCPYCRKTMRHFVTIDNVDDRFVVLCDPEDGGCDAWYVVVTETVVNAKPLRIEGESK